MKFLLTTVALAAAGAALRAQQQEIVFTEVPKADAGGPERTGRIAGLVNVACEKCSVVLYARAAQGGWFVQPLTDNYLTPVIDGAWSSEIHLGLRYAALLTKPGYAAQAQTEVLPARGEKIVAVAVVDGTP
jgi:hypothetical protein